MVHFWSCGHGSGLGDPEVEIKHAQVSNDQLGSGHYSFMTTSTTRQRVAASIVLCTNCAAVFCHAVHTRLLDFLSFNRGLAHCREYIPPALNITRRTFLILHLLGTSFLKWFRERLRNLLRVHVRQVST